MNDPAKLRTQVQRLRKGRATDRKKIDILIKEVRRLKKAENDSRIRMNILSARIDTISRSGTALQRMQRENERVAFARENRLRVELEESVRRLQGNIQGVIALAEREFRRLEAIARDAGTTNSTRPRRGKKKFNA
jgi:hypothetical protein